MSYELTRGERPTHRLPMPEGGKGVTVSLLERGQSIKRPGSTKHLLYGPKLVHVSWGGGAGMHATWFDYPDDPEQWLDTTPGLREALHDADRFAKMHPELDELERVPDVVKAADMEAGVRARRLRSHPYRKVAGVKLTRAGTVRIRFVQPDGSHDEIAYDPDDALEVLPD